MSWTTPRESQWHASGKDSVAEGLPAADASEVTIDAQNLLDKAT